MSEETELTDEERALRIYLISDGRRGERPAWFRFLCAARFAGMRPWELEDAPWEWKERILAAYDAVIWAEREMRRRGMAVQPLPVQITVSEGS